MGGDGWGRALNRAATGMTLSLRHDGCDWMVLHRSTTISPLLVAASECPAMSHQASHTYNPFQVDYIESPNENPPCQIGKGRRVGLILLACGQTDTPERQMWTARCSRLHPLDGRDSRDDVVDRTEGRQ